MPTVLAKSWLVELEPNIAQRRIFQYETIIKAREVSAFNIKTSLCNTFFYFQLVLEHDPGQFKLPRVVYY